MAREKRDSGNVRRAQWIHDELPAAPGIWLVEKTPSRAQWRAWPKAVRELSSAIGLHGAVVIELLDTRAGMDRGGIRYGTRTPSRSDGRALTRMDATTVALAIKRGFADSTTGFGVSQTVTAIRARVARRRM